MGSGISGASASTATANGQFRRAHARRPEPGPSGAAERARPSENASTAAAAPSARIANRSGSMVPTIGRACSQCQGSRPPGKTTPRNFLFCPPRLRSSSTTQVTAMTRTFGSRQ